MKFPLFLRGVRGDRNRKNALYKTCVYTVTLKRGAMRNVIIKCSPSCDREARNFVSRASRSVKKCFLLVLIVREVDRGMNSYTEE